MQEGGLKGLKLHPDFQNVPVDDPLEYLAGRNCWFDTSSTLWKLPAYDAKTILKKHGVERFLFGSDFPMWDHSDELKRQDMLDLSSNEFQAVLWDNAASLLLL